MDDIAIIGVGCLFPGAANPEQYWDNLINERDSRSALTRELLGIDPAELFEPHKGVKDRFYSMRGGYITDFQFDPRGYALPGDTLAGLDRLHHWSLYVARQALIDSGYLNNSPV